MTDEKLESLINILEIGYGENLKISYDIDDKTKLEKKEDSDISMTVAKIKGEGWKLIGEDVSDLF